ncbi:MAG: hypothetical protein ACPHBO_03665, partial [Cycloclasticus sp.]
LSFLLFIMSKINNFKDLNLNNVQSRLKRLLFIFLLPKEAKASKKKRFRPESWFEVSFLKYHWITLLTL